MHGYFKINRGWMDNPVFRKQKFTDIQAYIWLIEHAVFKAQKTRVGDYIVNLERGQCAFSQRFLAKKWKWSVGSVRCYLKKLSKHQIISVETSTGISVINICNYCEIQDYENYISAPNNGSTTNEVQSSSSKKNKGKTKDKKREMDFSYICDDLEEGNAQHDEFKKVMSTLHKQLGDNVFYNWFSEVSISYYDENIGTVGLKLKNQFVQSYVSANYINNIEKIWKSINPNIDVVCLE